MTGWFISSFAKTNPSRWLIETSYFSSTSALLEHTPPVPRDRAGWSITQNKQMTEVLGVDLSIRADSHRRVSRADCQLQEPLLLQRSALVD